MEVVQVADRKRPSKERGSRYGRCAPEGWGEEGEGKRPRRRLEEKLRKYEVHAEGYEFVPAMMHVLNRYCEGVPQREQTDLERRLTAALEEIPDGRAIVERAVRIDQEIPLEIKRRAFSPRFLLRQPDQPIRDEEIAEVVNRAAVLTNRSVASLAAAYAGKRPTGHLEGCCCPPDRPPDRPDPVPTPRPNQYEVTFTKLYCVDESDPEWWGSDEPYVVFAVLTEEMAETGTAAQGFHTPVYGDVDDGDTRPDSGDENLRIWGFTGPRSIASSVLIAGSCFENDLGNPEETTEGVRTALTTVATTAAGAGGVAGWVVAGVAVVGIGVTYLVDLIGADDAINRTLTLSLTEADADARTAGGPFLFPPMHFDGGDGDGIYDVYLRLRRV
jgi:hypothetical protein